MSHSAIVFYAKAQNGLRNLLHNLNEYTEKQKLEVFSGFKAEHNIKFIDRLDNLFSDCSNTLADGIIKKAETILFSDDFNLDELDLPTRIALYWIFSTLYFELKSKNINKYVTIPFFTGNAFGVFWAITMVCRKEHFTDKECILMAYEYGKILSAKQKNPCGNEKYLLELEISFASKYFSNYFAKPIHTFMINESILITLNRTSNFTTLINTKETDTLVDIVFQSFYETVDANTLQDKIYEKMKRFTSYEIVEL